MSDNLLALIEHKLESYDNYWGEGWSYWAWENGNGTEIEGLGKVTTVEQFGGQGQGNRAWVVVRVDFPNGTSRYFKKDGYHASHDGTYYDGYFSEVTPQEKVVTVYE